jgi:hypothetical protein
MVVANLRIAVEDPLVAARYKLEPDDVKSEDEPFFLDGPVAARVAVVDRDVETGQLVKPVKWSPRRRTYSVPEDISSPESIAVSVFGIVLETLALFERVDVLGHKVRWAFESPQLLIVPRAGIWENAFYDRYSQSLQCFSFAADGGEVHTALSRDIIAHETGHAILDAIVPPLYDGLTPETLALHEAIGDLTAIVMALNSRSIRDWLLRDHHEDLAGSTPVSQLANQFGQALGLRGPLRDAYNSATMNDVTKEPHSLCQVLTGAFWSAMVQLHKSALDRACHADDKSGEKPIGRALAISALRIGRILFRALDYLVPAEATFADYCRAVLRSDEQAYPEDETGYREVLKKEFVKRGIVKTESELESKPEQEWVSVDLNDVLESEWAAYAFVKKQRELLKVPRGVPFRLFPRQDVTRRYYLGEGKHEDHREVVFRLTWETTEENVGISGMPLRRAVFKGTTAVFADQTDKQGRHRLLSCLTTDRSDEHAQTRNETVRNLVDRGQLEIGNRRASFNTRPLAPSVFGRVTDKTLRLRGTARLLHLTEVEHDR